MTLFNVRTYGATGDGAADDYSSIAAAIVAAEAEGGTVYFPAGTYYTTSTIQTSTASAGVLSFAGDGRGVSVIKNTRPIHTIEIRYTGAGVVSVSDLTVEGPNGLGFDNGSIGIRWVTGGLTHSLVMTRVEVTGTHDTAASNSGGGTVRLIDCNFSSTDISFSMFEGDDTVAAGGASIYVEGGTWGTPNGDLSSVGSVGLYIHPHIPHVLRDVTFGPYGRYGVYQNGSPEALRELATITGCVFNLCEFAQTRGNGPTTFSNCTLSGSSSRLGASLGGVVTVVACSFTSGGPVGYGPFATSTVFFYGCSFVDTPMFTAGLLGKYWSLRSCTFVVTDAAPGWTGVSCVAGKTDFENVTFLDQTKTNTYQTFVRMTSSGPLVNFYKCRFLDGRGTLSSGIYATTGTATVDYCEFSSTRRQEAIYVQAAAGAYTVSGANNRFVGTYPFVQTAAQQGLTRVAGRAVTVQSAANINSSGVAVASADTWNVWGAASINNLTLPRAFLGGIRLVAAAGSAWALTAAGNITPLHTNPRQVGSVTTLEWNPSSGKWVEL